MTEKHSAAGKLQAWKCEIAFMLPLMYDQRVLILCQESASFLGVNVCFEKS